MSQLQASPAPGGQDLGDRVGGVTQLRPPLPGFAGRPEQPVHRADRAQVGPLVEQGGHHLRRSEIAEPLGVQHLEHPGPFGIAQRPRRGGSGLRPRSTGRLPSADTAWSATLRSPRTPCAPPPPGPAPPPLRSWRLVVLGRLLLDPKRPREFFWTSITVWACPRRRRRRAFSFFSRSISASLGSAPLRPGRPPRRPSVRWRRQSTRWEEYRPSRRSSAPISPGARARSASSRILSLYSAVKLRRFAFSGTSGSGGPSSVEAGSTRPRVSMIAISSCSFLALRVSNSGGEGVSRHLGVAPVPWTADDVTRARSEAPSYHLLVSARPGGRQALSEGRWAPRGAGSARCAKNEALRSDLRPGRDGPGMRGSGDPGSQAASASPPCLLSNSAGDRYPRAEWRLLRL